MGCNLAGIAVHGAIDRVLGSLEKVLHAYGVALTPVTEGTTQLNVCERNGWTMLQLGRLMPTVAIDLSRRLKSDVHCIDICEGYSFEHASSIAEGTLTLLYTMWQGEVVERLPSDLTLLLRQGFARTKRRLPAHVVQRVDSGDFSTLEGELFALFNESIAPIDVLDLALDAYEDPSGGQFTLVGRLEPLTMDLEAERFWQATCGPPLERS